MKSKAKLNVLIIEPSPIIATGLAGVLADSDTFTASATAASTDELPIARLRKIAPDVVILNPSVVNRDRRHNVRATLTDEFADTILVALAYAPCEDSLLRQFDGIINLLDSPAQILKKLATAVEQSDKTTSTSHQGLSEREREVLVFVARGLTNKEIAQRLNLSVFTVVTHRKNISRKLGINSISGLTVYAIMNRLVDITEL